MDSRKIAIYLVAKALGVDFSDFETSFEKRLVFQKLMYIAFQSSEFKSISYRYGFYKHGPYSPELTQIGYEIAKESGSLKQHKFNANGEKNINNLKEKLPETVKKIIYKLKFEQDDLNELEAITTLMMACKNYQFPDLDKKSYKALLEKERSSIIKDFNISKKGLVKDETLKALLDEASEYLVENMSGN